MAHVYINGLIPGNTDGGIEDNSGSIVAILDPQFVKGEEGHRIFVGYSNQNGELQTEIDNKYINRNLRIHIRDAGTIGISANVKCEPYGLCYTAKIIIDGVYSNTSDVHKNWKTEENYDIAHEKMNSYIKNHKYSNPWVRLFHYFVLLSSIFIGLFIAGWPGVIVAFCVVILLEVIGPYALGLKPFRLTRRSS